jgi:hypothetical protein
VRALDLASRALLHDDHPDAIEACVVLLELGGVLERYERPSVGPLVKLKTGVRRKPVRQVGAKPAAQMRQCLYCGKKLEAMSSPKKLFCCPTIGSARTTRGCD